MASADWRNSLSMTDRFDNIQKLSKHYEQTSATPGEAQKTAFSAETEFFKLSESRQEYESACNSFVIDPSIEVADQHAASLGKSTTIGPFDNCYHISSGLVSEVYRSDTLALKVITETHNVEPHNATREVQILRGLSHNAIVKLREVSKDDEGRLVLVFPFMPLTLAGLLDSTAYHWDMAVSIFRNIFSALSYLHDQGIIHRDIKPSNILLETTKGPACLADFGTAWHPKLSLSDEPVEKKFLEVGTTCYRAPETMFGNKSYDTSLDMWAAGAMLAECCREPPKPLFHSPPTDEDGNQLALILSIFKTLGTPTTETWPEAKHFSTPPFEWYNIFEGQSFETLLPHASEEARHLVESLVRYESSTRLTAKEALLHAFLQ